MFWARARLQWPQYRLSRKRCRSRHQAAVHFEGQTQFGDVARPVNERPVRCSMRCIR
jgi:hypothetical protein